MIFDNVNLDPIKDKKNTSIDVEQIICDYNAGISIETLAKHNHVGKNKIRTILISNGITLTRGRREKTSNSTLKVKDWKICKYPPVEGFHYIATYKEDGKIFEDHMNQGGFLTNYIKKKNNIEVPSLYFRRQYYMKTGDYWWEQWFDITLVKNTPTKKCPYCNWETIDINNKSGAFETHLKEKHNITKFKYLEEYPDDKGYFTLVNKTLDRQMSTDEDIFVKCAICGKKLSRIDGKHLSTHGISRLEYIQKYNSPTYSISYYRDMLENAMKMNLSLSNRNDIFTSKEEKYLTSLINGWGLECFKNRSILNGRELDIYIPSLKIAIEYNGNKHHTEWFGGKNKNYHLEKTLKCKEQGIKLIHIFDDEFHYNGDIVINKLRHLLGINKDLPKIYGRKCTINLIENKTAKSFLTKYHIQGFDASTLYYGAFHNNELIAVMSFLRDGENSWELTRFASHYGYICCGVGGKLFNTFIKENNPTCVKSFADRRWTINEENNLYIQLGFTFDSYTPPDYRYFNSSIDRYKRFHKFGFRKKILLKKHPDKLNENLTETEMVKILGYDRIWDCGLIKYVWKKKDSH